MSMIGLNDFILPGPENIARRILSNGLTVMTHANPDTLSVVVTGYLVAGSIFDPDDKLGLSHFTSLALMRGTQERSFHRIYSQLESIGASLSVGASTHTISFYGHALIEDLPFLLRLLSEVLTTPVFPADQVEKLRTQLLTGLKIRAQDTSDMSSLVFDKMLYPNHPYGRPEDGYVESITAISRQDLSSFHGRHFGPRKGVVVIAGPVNPLRAINLVEKYLGGWRNPSQPDENPLPALKPIRNTKRHHTAIPGKSQIDVVLGTHGPSRLSEDYYAAAVGNSILGQFGLMGRIGESVREKSGLAYYAYSSLNAGVGPGSWEFTAGTNPRNLDKAIQLILAEIKRFVSKPVTAGELADVKSNLVGRLPLAFESNSGIASALINLERYQLGLDYYRRYEGIINAITREDIRAKACKYLDPERMIISSAGTLES